MSKLWEIPLVVREWGHVEIDENVPAASFAGWYGGTKGADFWLMAVLLMRSQISTLISAEDIEEWVCVPHQLTHIKLESFVLEGVCASSRLIVLLQD